MKVIYGLVFVWCLAPALMAAEKVATAANDYEFHRAVEDGKVSVREMLRRLKADLPSLEGPAESRPLYFEETYAAATKRATAAEFVQLEELLRAIPPTALCFDRCFSAYVAVALRVRVAQFAKKPERLAWAPTTEPLPKELAAAPADFQQAWKLYQAIIAPYRVAVKSPSESKPSPKKLPELSVDLRRVVGPPQPDAWRHLAAHEWGGWCGTGSDMLYHPRNRAILLSLLADGKWREAAGAALDQVPSSLMNTADESLDLTTLDFLTALGLDWEQVMLGSILPVQAYNPANNRAVVASAFQECDAWRLLAARGSERAVRQGLYLIRWKRLDPPNAAEFLTVALGPEGDRSQGVLFSSRPMPVRTVALPKPVRREVLALLGEYLAPANDSAELMDTLQALPPSVVKSLRQPLTALISHPVHAVADKARELLREAGLVTGNEPIAASAPPLRFRLLLNGQPLSETELTVDLVDTPDPKPGSHSAIYKRALAPSRELTTSRKGELAFPLNDCLEPDRLAAVRFRCLPPFTPELAGIPSISLEKNPAPPLTGEWPGPWIVHQVAARAGREGLTEIALRATDLQLKLTAFEGMQSDLPIEVQLRVAKVKEPYPFDQGAARILTRAGLGANFRRLQPGEYTIAVRAPGLARADREVVISGESGLTQEIQLQPGRTVRGVVVFPGGDKVNLSFVTKLFREDGTEIARDRFDEWNGLAFGRYTLRVRSSSEKETEAKKAGFSTLGIPKEDRNEAREVSLVIDAATPATLDLGEIRVTREKP